MDEKDFKKIMIPVAVLILAVLSFIIVKPIAVPIFTGLLLAYIFYPVYKIIRKKIPNKTFVASLMVKISELPKSITKGWPVSFSIIKLPL